MLWLALTVAAAPLTVARNALQRGMIGDAGPWGATLVRFLFGLPFALAFFAVAALFTPDAHPRFSVWFGLNLAVGAAAQVGATAALLVAMRRSGFAVATFMQQSSLPFAALMGWAVFGDRLAPLQWGGLAAATAGLCVLSWPRSGAGPGAVAGALFGLLSGGLYAFALNGYRQAGAALEPDHLIYSALASVCLAQFLQSAALGGLLAIFRPGALMAVLGAWRQSLWAGLCGGAASGLYFAALALYPAGPVRAVSVLEAPIAAAAGRRLFKERLNLRQIVGGGMTGLGVLATALGHG
jgi:drug/metabolite transporter (DMT)-like permease